ncbi:hypothetical protein [Streptomyces longwoodensis]|uniref:hypothetical protein n=1 Tax=Streptomyces longwoodensis TaxID=68231 RepID=UPI0034079364
MTTHSRTGTVMGKPIGTDIVMETTKHTTFAEKTLLETGTTTKEIASLKTTAAALSRHPHGA